MKNQNYEKFKKKSNENDNHPIIHPDLRWLQKIIGWTLCGTLSFKHRYLDTQNDKVKDFFGRYNWHLSGEYNWKNIPSYWKWEFDKNDRLHCHFVMLDTHPEFYWLHGSENTFADAPELAKWMKNNWKHGISHYAIYRDTGWLNYITKQNSLMNSCFTPPIHFLKRQVEINEESKVDKMGCFFPDYYGVNTTPKNNGISDKPVCKKPFIPEGNGLNGGQIV